MSQRAREAFNAALYVGVAAIVLMLAYGIFEIRATGEAIRDTQESGSPILLRVSEGVDAAKSAAEDANATNEQLADCLTPGGECYERSQKNTQDVIGSINEITYYAAACADQSGTQTVREIQGCVIEKLAAADRGDQ